MPSVTSSLKSMLMRLVRSRAGNVGMLFGFAAIPTVIAVGGAVDYLAAQRTKTRLQGAVDAAAIGAMTKRGFSTSERESYAQTLFSQNAANSPTTAGATATVTSGAGSMTVATTLNMPTTLLKVIGMDSIPLTVQATVTALGKKLELSIMTDITGSMNDTRNGQRKIDGLKLAANDLLDILLPDGGANDDARVALVPFANVVNVGNYASAVTGLATTQPNPKGGASLKLITCVTERTGTYAYTDDVPASGRWIGAPNQGGGAAYDNNGGCDRSTWGWGSPSAMPEIIPLTNDKQKLRQAVDTFTPAGSTAGHIGTAWAWYTLVPEWNSIFNVSTPPKPYNDPDYKKFVVLMTDGEYNTQYSSADSKTQALALCQGMKDKGITVFTVGFGFEENGSDTAAKDTLVQCASGTGHYFFPYDGDALRQAFVQIGNQVTSWAGKVRVAN